MSKSLIPLLLAVFVLAGSSSSCKKDPVSPGCDTCKKPCDTCNLNQDSITRIKDSLAHAFEWKEYINVPSGDIDSHFSGVWVFGPNDMIIVGASLWHFDGTNFVDMHPIRNGSNTILDGALSGFSIFCLSKTDFWLVSGSIAFHTGDGVHFDDNRKGLVNACWGPKSNDIFFVGNGGNIFHYDGTNFINMTSNTTKDLHSVWGTSSSDVWACGFNSSTAESELLHFNGNNWTEIDLSTVGWIGVGEHALESVWACDSAGYHIAIGAGSQIWRKTNNGIWRNDSSRIPNALGGNAFIGLGVNGNNVNDFMAVGGWGFVAHWNGKTWKKFDTLFDYSNNDYFCGAFSMNGNTACAVGTKSGQKWIAVGTRKQ